MENKIQGCQCRSLTWSVAGRSSLSMQKWGHAVRLMDARYLTFGCRAEQKLEHCRATVIETLKPSAPVVQKRQHHTVGALDHVLAQVDAAGLVHEARDRGALVVGVIHIDTHGVCRGGHCQRACVRHSADGQPC